MTGSLNDPWAFAAQQDEAWQELISRLIDHVPDLVREFRERFASVDNYGPGVVSEEDLEKTASDTMSMLVLQLAGRSVPDDLATVPTSLGARRARQGVPLNLLLEAIRLDFRVLWNMLQKLAGSGSEALLVRNVELLLTTVETFVSEVQRSFLAEEAVLRRDSRLITARYISRIFSADLTRADVVAEIAEGLSVPSSARFEVIVVVGHGIAAAEQLASRREMCAWFGYNRGGGYCLFRPQLEARRLPEAVTALPGGYIRGVQGIAGIPAAAAAAALIAEHGTPSSGLVSVATAWTGVAQALLQERIPGFSTLVLEPLDKTGPHERERLLEVIAEYARTGSIKETAERLYCHRNTVVNRLHSFHELTGLDMTVPLEAALALCALGDEVRRC